MRGPYEGISVLELGEGSACAYAGQLLADRGATVIKAEPPEGDSLRWRDPHRSHESRTFQWLARGKQSIVVDETTRDGKDVLQRLCGNADVVLTNWSPIRMADANLDPEALVAANPRLIFLAGSRFGSRGEWRDRPASDTVLQAYSGLAASEGKRGDDGTPLAVSCAEITQYPAGVMMSMGVAAALLHRERTGHGQIVSTSELAAALIIQGGRIGRFAADGPGADAVRDHLSKARASRASFEQTAAPFGAATDPISRAGRMYYRSFATKDGALFMGALSKSLRDKIRTALGIEFLLRDDPDFDPSDPALPARCLAFESTVLEQMAAKTTAQWLALLEAAGVPCAEVTFPEDLSGNEQALANGYIVNVEHPVDGPQKHVAPPVQFGAFEPQAIAPAPSLGQHTAVVLDALKA